MEDKQTAAQEVEDYWTDLFVAFESLSFPQGADLEDRNLVFSIFLLIGILTKYEEIHAEVFLLAISNAKIWGSLQMINQYNHY